MSDTWLHATFSISFEVAVPTPLIFMLRPRSNATQWVAEEEYKVVPAVEVNEFTDGFGNFCQRMVAPIGEFSVRTSVEVRVPGSNDRATGAGFVTVAELPDDVLAFLLPSRYCESDRFGDMAFDIVANQALGYEQVVAITRWVHGAIRNTPLSSTYPVSAVEVNQRGEGVCRDLAHLSIALCRALCIPARMVVGYLLGLRPMDIHAWFEVYIGGQWVTFDATCPDDIGSRIVIAHGRDAADVAIYNQYGPLLLPNDMVVTVAQISRL